MVPTGNPKRSGPARSRWWSAVPVLVSLLYALLTGCATAVPEGSGGESLARLDPSPPALVNAKPAAKESFAPFVPSPMPVVRRMLEMADVTSEDVVYDLGCGDGRIVVEAARKYGARGVGVDYDLRRCNEARDRAEREGVSELVEIRHEDIRDTDLSEATVVTLYLLPASTALLAPRLRSLTAGTRIVAHDYGIEGWPPLRAAVVETPDFDRHLVYLWVVARSAGADTE